MVEQCLEATRAADTDTKVIPAKDTGPVVETRKNIPNAAVLIRPITNLPCKIWWFISQFKQKEYSQTFPLIFIS